MVFIIDICTLMILTWINYYTEICKTGMFKFYRCLYIMNWGYDGGCGVLSWFLFRTGTIVSPAAQCIACWGPAGEWSSVERHCLPQGHGHFPRTVLLSDSVVGGKTKAQASRPNLRQLWWVTPTPELLVKTAMLLLWWHRSSPPSSAPLCFSESPTVFILVPSPGNLLHTDLYSLVYLLGHSSCDIYSSIKGIFLLYFLSLIPEHYHGFMDVSEIHCVMVHLHHYSFWMLRFSQMWPVGASSSWLLCSFHMFPLILIFEQVLAF